MERKDCPGRRGKEADRLPDVGGGWQNGFRLAMTIAGTTIGAGFASGREIWEFFTVYGVVSLQGIVLFAGLFMLCCWLLLGISWHVRGSSYADVLARFLPPKIATLYDGLLLVYLFSLSVVMFAASGAIFQDQGRPFTIGVLLMAVAVFGGLLFNVQGLLTLNSWVTPLLSGLLVVIAAGFIADQLAAGAVVDPDMEGGAVMVNPSSYGAWASAIVYTAFNLLPMVGVLTASAATCTHPRQLLLGTWLGGLLLGGLAALVNSALLLLPKAAVQQEMLLLELAAALPLRIDGLVSLILWLAVFTTALSCMYGLAGRLSAVRFLPYPLMVGLLVLSVMPCSYFGFATLVKILYPIYGIAGLFFVGCLLMAPLRGPTRGLDRPTPPAGR